MSKSLPRSLGTRYLCLFVFDSCLCYVPRSLIIYSISFPIPTPSTSGSWTLLYVGILLKRNRFSYCLKTKGRLILRYIRLLSIYSKNGPVCLWVSYTLEKPHGIFYSVSGYVKMYAILLWIIDVTYWLFFLSLFIYSVPCKLYYHFLVYLNLGIKEGTYLAYISKADHVKLTFHSMGCQPMS